MKKFLFLAAALLALGISTACADSDRPIDVAQLPQKAQQFIQKHFAGEKVATRTANGKKWIVVIRRFPLR